MADKTEAPTSRRIEEAREEGRVARSVELNSAAILLVGSFLLRGMGRPIFTSLENMIVEMTSIEIPDQMTFKWLLQNPLADIIQVLLPLFGLMVGLLMTGVIVTVAQTGFMWTSKNVGFKLDKLNPMKGFQRFFSKQGLIELGRALIKLSIVGFTIYSFLKGQSNSLLILGQSEFDSALGKLVDLATSLMIQVAGVYAVLAVADYAFQRWQFTQSLKMSKDEIKEEIKRSEGDPFLRARIRGQMRRMARMRMMSKVPKASVIITNPTHFAVAIQYEPNKMKAPRLVAKGANLVAHKIVEIARKNNVPVIQNVLLARAVFHTVKIDKEIPVELYRAVAEVLAYVYRMRGKTSFHPTV